MSRRKKDYSDDNLADLISGIFALLLIGVVLWAWQNPEKVKFYGYVSLAVILVLVIAGVIIFIFLRKKRTKTGLDYFEDNKLMAMFKGMTPDQFEGEVAKMFSDLGYKTELTGRPHDGGVDIIATKDGEKYYVQCKKYITNQAGVHDVRDFLGAVTNGLVKRGFFITTNTFTIDAEKFAEGNPRLELIDGLELVKWYRLANGDKVEDIKSDSEPIADEKCPQCGGNLILRSNHKTGEKFYGCSNYPKCHFMKSFK